MVYEGVSPGGRVHKLQSLLVSKPAPGSSQSAEATPWPMRTKHGVPPEPVPPLLPQRGSLREAPCPSQGAALQATALETQQITFQRYLDWSTGVKQRQKGSPGAKWESYLRHLLCMNTIYGYCEAVG